MKRNTRSARFRFSECFCSIRAMLVFILQQGRGGPAADPFHGHAQTDPDPLEIRHQHPEDHAVHEDGVGRQVRARRTRTAPGQAVRRRRPGKTRLRSRVPVFLHILDNFRLFTKIPAPPKPPRRATR